jgi:hypothetical protein
MHAARLLSVADERRECGALPLAPPSLLGRFQTLKAMFAIAVAG